MKSRYLVLGLSLVLALALAVPALGGPTNPIASISATVKQTANKALKKANAAQTAANNAQATATSAEGAADSAGKAAKAAQTTANTAQSTATSALSNAKTAQTTADGAKTTADSAKTAAAAAQAAADAAQTTANSKFGSTINQNGDGSGTVAGTGFDLSVCPSGSDVTGGGYFVTGTGDDEVVPYYAASYGNAWYAGLNRIPGGTGTWNVTAVVTCAQP
jgi:membrane protein involved in colicin uptake